MKTNGSGVILTFVSFLCLALIAYSTYMVLDGKDIINGTNIVNEYTFKEQGSITEIESSSTIGEESAEFVLAEGNIVGSITEEFISPYNSANTYYNKIYVKNKSGQPLNIEEYIKSGSNVYFTKNDDPQVLIVHTHTTESYLKTSREVYTSEDTFRTKDNSLNVVAVGSVIAKKLNDAGFNTLHAQTVHDTSYTGSYARSAETIKQYLEKYPSIKLVIDIHRDAIAAGDNVRVKPVTDVKGKKTAQVMLVMCCGEGIEGFNNWQDNLRFALKYQQTMEVMFPGFARAVSYISYKYNQDLSTPSLLMEVGTEVNSIEEALNAANFAAEALIAHLNTLTY